MKIHSLDLVAQICRELRADGSKIVLSHGCFDVIHLAHVRHLRVAKDLGDALIVTVTPDQFVGKGPGKPVFTAKQRAETLAAFEFVDYVAVNEWPTAVETIKLIQPHVYAKGGEYHGHIKNRAWTPGLQAEKELVEAQGGELVFTFSPGQFQAHSTEIMKCIQ